MPSEDICKIKVSITEHSGFKLREIRNSLIWYIKQLFPFTYYSEYTVNVKGGVRQVCIWKMRLGRCYNIRRWDIKDTVTE